MRANSSRNDEINAPHGPARKSAWLRWLAPLMLLAAGFALQALAARYPAFVERYYSRKLFPPTSRLLSLFNGLFSFSIAELMIYVLIVFTAGALIYQAREIYLRRKRIVRTLRTDLIIVLWVCASALVLFLLLWGFNYHRPPLAAKLGFDGRTVTNEQLKTISETIVNELNANYGASHTGGAANDAGLAPLGRAEMYEVIESAYQHQSPLLEARGRYGPPKPVYFSGLMSRFGLSGIYAPFTGEPNFNAAQPDFDLPYVMAHEKAHQRGFAREDEANFLAFLVCVNSTHPYVRYSGYLNALKVVGTLADSDPEYYKALVGRIGEGPRNDLRARNAFWMRYQGRTSMLAQRVNNSYLKANRVESGVRNYSEDVALIVGYYLKRTTAVQNQK